MDIKYSVLMSVYHKESPQYFRESVNSMTNQTIPPNEIIIVKDGPLGDALEEVVDELKANNIIKFVSLEKNQGLGTALNIGLRFCKNEYVARMDTDDISLADRCEKQLEYFKQNPSISVVGSYISEFIDCKQNVVSCRKVPITDKQIKKYLKKRNPFNHMSVMFKNSHVKKAGGYKPFYFNEDYYLWVRMLLCGYEFGNIGQSLVMVRINEDTFFRRGGWRYFTAQKKLLGYMLKNGVISFGEYAYSGFISFVVRVLLPNKVRKWVYLRWLRD